MPELSRFFGIIIRMYAEPFAPHHQPHLHAYYQEAVAVYGLDPVELFGIASVATAATGGSMGRNAPGRIIGRLAFAATGTPATAHCAAAIKTL